MVIVLGAVAWIAVAVNDRPSLAPYAHLELPAGGGPRHGPTAVTVRFLGVSSLLVSDGTTAWMTDGFVSRPPLWRTALGRVAPDEARIDWALERVEADTLAAVIVLHSHYDHAMDAPIVARRTGAVLVGSPSTHNVGRGLGLTEAHMRLMRDGEPLRFGAFEILPIRSRHFPHGMAMGEIEMPLEPPARTTEYREGGTFTLLVRHPAGSMLIHGSAGWVPGKLDAVSADVVLLGVAGLGSRDDAYRRAYHREVVEAVGPKLIVPIHWDDFTLPLTRPLVPMPNLLDDVAASMDFLVARTEADPDLRLGLLPLFEPVTLLPVR